MSDTSTMIRSPSYPSMSLRDAVVAIGKIEGHYRSAPVDRLNAARLIGFGSPSGALSGPAGKALADLASYGLLERAGKGAARVTERARDILHAPNAAARRETLRAAALEPALFRQIREYFSGVPIPPEAGVETFLHRQGFNPNAVRPAAKAFLQTMSYLEELGESESHGATPPPPHNDGESGGEGHDAPKIDPPPPKGKVPVMEDERVVFTEEGQPNQYLKLVASGDLDEGLLDALTDFVKRQRRRLGLSPLPPPAFGKAPRTLLGGASADEDEC